MNGGRAERAGREGEKRRGDLHKQTEKKIAFACKFMPKITRAHAMRVPCGMQKGGGDVPEYAVAWATAGLHQHICCAWWERRRPGFRKPPALPSHARWNRGVGFFRSYIETKTEIGVSVSVLWFVVEKRPVLCFDHDFGFRSRFGLPAFDNWGGG